MKRFNVVVCGGTFDHLHKGHKEFLRFTFLQGKMIIIGVTSDEFVNKSKIKNKISNIIESYTERRRELLSFLKKERVLDRTEIVKIDDVFGPTLDKDLSIDAIVVGKDTKKGGELINSKRKALGLKSLKVLVTPSSFAEDEKEISSERIRSGEIDREGKTFIDQVFLRKTLYLPLELRSELRKPFGKLIFDLSKDQCRPKNGLIATVGDVTTKKFNDLELGQKISVVDFKVGRRKIYSTLKDLDFSDSSYKSLKFKIINPPGRITPKLFDVCRKVWSEDKRIIVLINGEEDLAVIPLILTAPLGTSIFYGQPNRGVIKTEVTEVSKRRIYNLIKRFKIQS